MLEKGRFVKYFGVLSWKRLNKLSWFCLFQPFGARFSKGNDVIFFKNFGDKFWISSFCGKCDSTSIWRKLKKSQSFGTTIVQKTNLNLYKSGIDYLFVK